VFTVQRRAWSGIICEYWVPACRNLLLNRICVQCQFWDHRTQQESGCEVCLNFIPEQGNTWLYSLGKSGIHEPCFRIRCSNWISFRQSIYPWMIRDILWWLCLRRVEMLIAILMCNWLYIIQHYRVSEYPEFFRNSSVRCACNRQPTHNLNYTGRFRCTWWLESRSHNSVSQFHTDNNRWRWYGTAASSKWHIEKCTASLKVN
jgi:hypothetical protein